MILSKEELKARGQEAMAKTMEVALPELGDDMSVKVKGFTISETATINQVTVSYDEESGRTIHDRKQDMLLSVVACLVEPAIDLNDTGWVADMPSSVIERILAASRILSGRTQREYDAYKAFLKENPYAQRIYSVCARHLHRLPSELEGITESEFNTLLAALEIDAENEQAAGDKMTGD